VATLRIPEEALAKLQAAAAARHISVEEYLIEIAATGAGTIPTSSAGISEAKPDERAAAAQSIRKLSAEIKGKATIAELIADKRAGHKY
jgi:hypothetical protein